MSEAFAQPFRSNSFFSAALAESDPEIARAIEQELGRQRDEIELIASENIVSRAVLEAQGSVMTNKYAEGYPGRRYYGGCQFVDVAETLAIDRARRLFGCRFANVQPNSGSQANQAVFLALMRPGDVFMGLDLAAGGHLTHGSPVNLSGRWFKPVAYGVDRETHRVDMDQVESLARACKPKLIIAGGSAYARFWDFQRFREICDSVGAYFMVDMAHFAGLHQRHEHGLIGLRAGIRLDVGEAAGEQLAGALDRQIFRDVDELAAAVIAPAGIAFRVLVGHHRALRLQHRARDDVFRGDQLDLVAQTAELQLDRAGDLGIGFGEPGGKERVGADRLGGGFGHGRTLRR